MENPNDFVFAFRIKAKVQIYVCIYLDLLFYYMNIVVQLFQTIVHWLLVEYDFIMKRDKWK